MSITEVLVQSRKCEYKVMVNADTFDWHFKFKKNMWRNEEREEGRERESKFTRDSSLLKPNGSKESNSDSQSLLKVPFQNEPFQQTLI